MDKQKVKIIDVKDFPSIDPARIGKFDKIITYQTDAFHTYLITLASETFSDEKLTAAIREDMKKRKEIIGKELEI